MVTFANITNGDDSGLDSGGVDVLYYLSTDGQTLEGRTNATEPDGSDGELIFTVQINQADGDYTFTLAQTIDDGSGVDFADLSGEAGNPAYKLIQSSTPDPLELLVTPIGNTTVNSDEDDIATGSQFIEFNDGIRFDFGQFTNHANGPGPNDDRFTIDSHDTVNGFRFTIDQISNGSVVDFLVTAIDADEDGNAQQLNIDPTDTDDDIDPITSIKVYDDNGVLVDEFTATDTTTYSFDVTFNGDGTVHFENFPAEYSVQVYTVDGYNRVEVFNDGTASPDGKFSLSELQIEITQTGTPQTLVLDLAITDGDGDSVTMTDAISITIDPAGTPPVVLDMDGDGTEFLDRSAGVAYDYGAGLVATGWAGADDAILVRDANGDGTVTDASEFVFGDADTTDMEALAAEYGSALDANDADYGKFMVWTDANSNGVTDAGELQSLSDAGITSVGLVSDGVSYSAANGDVYVAGSGTYTRADGTTGATADAMFATGEAKATQEVERVAANSNSLTIAAALAAAGISSAAAATEPVYADADDGAAISAISAPADGGVIGTLNSDTSPAFDSAALDGGFEASLQPMSSSSHSAIAASQIGELVVVSPVHDGPAALLDATDLGAMLQMPAASKGMTVTQPVAAVEGQQEGAVEQIVADALEGGAATPSIDDLLAALPGAGLGENAGPDSLASPIGDSVPTWDTGQAGAFTNGAANIITTEAMVLHHDAVQPV